MYNEHVIFLLEVVENGQMAPTALWLYLCFSFLRKWDSILTVRAYVCARARMCVCVSTCVFVCTCVCILEWPVLFNLCISHYGNNFRNGESAILNALIVLFECGDLLQNKAVEFLLYKRMHLGPKKISEAVWRTSVDLLHFWYEKKKIKL